MNSDDFVQRFGAKPKPDLDLINTRLEATKQDFEVWQVQQGAKK